MNKPTISLIAAISKNRVLGKGNELIWKIPEDQKRFRSITSGHPVIMGRKTFESIGQPLPRRTNFIITRDAAYAAEGCTVVHSLEEGIRNAHDPSVPGSEEIFIVGGGQIYEQALPMADRLYLTVINQEAEGDAFFPPYDEFKTVVEDTPGEHQGLQYRFVTLER